jgi:hypothetical protein
MTPLHSLSRAWLARLHLAASCLVTMVVIWWEPSLPAHQVLERSGSLAWCFVLVVSLLAAATMVDALANDLAGVRGLRLLGKWRAPVLLGLALCLAALAFVHASDRTHMAIALYVLNAVSAAGIAFFDIFERHRSPKE